MFEVLIIGLVGLTYTCVQTLFFLNCLNSRRREQRRLEKAYRESIRKLKEGSEVSKKSDNREIVNNTSQKENGSGIDDVENGIQRGVDDESPEEEEESQQGHLVTRLVVKSGKEVSPNSHGRAGTATDLLGVKVHKAVVKLSNSFMGNERKNLNDYDVENGLQQSIDQKDGPGYNITVNSNMIQVNGGEGRTTNTRKESAYESLEGDPLSILTEVTVCEDQEISINSNPKRQQESVSLNMVGEFEEKSQPVDAIPTSVGDIEGLGGTDEFQEVQESQMDIDDVCSTEDELDSFYQKSVPFSKRGDVNLVNTISQILSSPPESMEPGSENHSLESQKPQASSQFLEKTNEGISSQPDSATNRSTMDLCGDLVDTADAPGLSSNDNLSKQRRRESRKEITRCEEEEEGGQLTVKASRGNVPPRPPRSKGGTWTLPRNPKRFPDGYSSLNRAKEKPSIRGRESTGSEKPGREGEESLVSSGQTWLHPAGGQFAKRDAAPGGGQSSCLNNTCHSTPVMAGAAITPLDAIGGSSPRPSAFDGNKAKTSRGGNILYSSNHENVSKENSFSEKNFRHSGDTVQDDLGLTDSDPGSPSLQSDDHTDSEGSADSLYYTASDHTGSDACSEIRGDSDESFETILYEPVEPSKTKVELETKCSNSISDSKNKTMSVNQNEKLDRDDTLNRKSKVKEPVGKDDTLNRKSKVKEPVGKDDTLNRKNKSKDKSESKIIGTIDSKNSKNEYKKSQSPDDSESIGSESHYGSVSDSDHHQDSGYESPVKADVHSSDDAASVISTSSVENHYEDIDPARMGRQASSRRGRSAKDSPSRDAPRAKDDRDDDEESVEARQRQRLQELDDLIAEFGDVSSGSNDSLPSHRHLHLSHSVSPSPSPSSSPSSSKHSQRSPLSRTTSEPNPPPPPPLPTHTPSPRSSPAVTHRSSHTPSLRSSSSHDGSSPRVSESSSSSDGPEEDAVMKPSEFVRRNSQRGEAGSFGRGHKKVNRPVSLPLDVAEHYGKIMSSNKDKPPTTTQDDSGSATLPAKPHLSSGKSLPFIPPKFPSQPSGSGLIKPSEYLRSLGGTTGRSPTGDVKSLVAMHSSEALSSSFDNHEHSNNDNNNNVHDTQPASMPPGPLPSIPEATEEEASKNIGGAPPPPPAPPAPPTSSSANTLNRTSTLNSNNTNSKTVLPTISVTDLQSVQLRKTEVRTPKPTSVPLRMPLSPEPALALAKDDVIAELKMGVDISGIKKLKSERAKEEAKHGIIEKEELEKQFSAVNFVDQIPEKDNAGNRIPEWKRQMLARKAAERAKKQAEEQRQQQLEEKRLQAIPPWKRQLLMRRDDDGKRDRPVTPRTQSPVRIALHIKH